jgi:hypothetical protein
MWGGYTGGNGENFNYAIALTLNYKFFRIFFKSEKHCDINNFNLNFVLLEFFLSLRKLSVKKFSTIYIILPVFCLSVCPSVCLTLYRLGPWTWYRLDIGVIRTSMTWTRDFGKKFSRKVTSGQITEEKLYATNAFLWEKYRVFCFNVWKQSLLFILSN